MSLANGNRGAGEQLDEVQRQVSGFPFSWELVAVDAAPRKSITVGGLNLGAVRAADAGKIGRAAALPRRRRCRAAAKSTRLLASLREDFGV